MVEATVHQVYKQEKMASTQTVVVLKARDRERYLPIWISFPQAIEIAQQVQGLKTERPTTYNLMAQLVERLGGRLDAVHVTFLEGTIYHATLRLMVNNTLEEVDCRPSDALPLAMAGGAPIFVDDELLSKEGCDSATSFHGDGMGELNLFEFKDAA
ncbi:MAG TPA: bifunctional nuclease family protein [Abditibacteriaceae bacterium]|jgi:hypothetical protein